MAVGLKVRSERFHPSRVLKDFDRLNEEFKFEVIRMGVEYMKRNSPVKTGKLRDSVTVVRDDKSALITPNVFYASYVNEGTAYITPRRFVEKTAKELRRDIPDVAKRVFKNWDDSWNWGKATGTQSPFFPGGLSSAFSGDF